MDRNQYPYLFDGNTIVVIRRTTVSYETVESGRLSSDGETLTLHDEHGGEREVSADELAQLQPVIAANRIAACHGFDFFRLVDD